MVQDSHTSAAGNELTRMHADSRSALTDRAASLHEVGKLLVMEAWLSNDLPVLSCKLLHLMASIWALVTQEPLHLLHKGQLGACRAVCDLGHGQLGCSTGCTVSPCCLATATTNTDMHFPIRTSQLLGMKPFVVLLTSVLT